MPRPRKRKGPGRPPLGKAARTRTFRFRLTEAEYKRIEAYVAKENAEIKADGHDDPPATVSSWIRDMIADAIAGV